MSAALLLVLLVQAAPVDVAATPVVAQTGVDLGARPGPLGLPRMSTADAGLPGHLRLGLAGELFFASDFLVSAPGSSGDRHTRLRGTLGVSGTPMPGLELFATFAAASNRNRRVCDASGDACTSELGRVDPEVIRTAVALGFGAKVVRRLNDRVAIGGEAGLRLLPALDGLAFDLTSTSGYANLLAGARVLGPLETHLRAGFYLDRSWRRSGDPSFAEGAPVSSRLVAAFGHDLGRSRAQLALGLAAPLPWLGRTWRPSLEYHVDIVTRGDSAFAAAAMAQDARNRDQHWMSVGLDVAATRGLFVGASVDLALRSPGFRYGTRLPPYNVVLAVTQSLDLGAPRVITRVVERAPAVHEGHATGRVVGADCGAIDGAVVAVQGQPRARVATDPDGGFRTAGLAPGAATLLVTAARFAPATVPVVIRAGQATEVELRLAPAAYPLRGRVQDAAGNAVVAIVRVLGPGGPRELAVGPDGGFTAQLPAGRYQLQPVASGHLGVGMWVDVPEVGDAPLTVTLRPRPPRPRLAVKGEGEAAGLVAFDRPLGFVVDPVTAQASAPAPDTLALLDELVDLVLQQPDDRRRLRVEAHWDRSLPELEAQRLTERQAEAVVAYLVRRGVARDRLEAVGLGSAPVSGTQQARRRLDIFLRD